MLVMRGEAQGVKYFGPYAQGMEAIRETVDQFLRSSRCARAATGVQAVAQMGRPCLLGYIGKCSARASAGSRRRTTANSPRVVSFLGTGTERFMKDLERQMRAASAVQDSRDRGSPRRPRCPCAKRWSARRWCSWRPPAPT